MAAIAARAAEIRDPKTRKQFREVLQLADALTRAAGSLRKTASTLQRQATGVRYKTYRGKK
ncbi:MAG: hypothetical protein ACLQO1_25235 [Steroidobacteraceae bacterium]